MATVDVGIKQAKTDLSKLISEVQQGKRVFLMNRGKRIVELVPVSPVKKGGEGRLGRGMFKDKIRLPLGWDSQKARRQATNEVLMLMGIDD